jgi:hypothetical protein
VAHAETKPDENAEVEAREANLESKEPRAGFVASFSAGAGLVVGGDIGVGRGGAASARIGHVATRTTVITFEIALAGALHKLATNSAAVTDTNAGLFAGALRYASRTTWVRMAGGLNVYNANIGSDQAFTRVGLGGLVGVGVDLVRWGYLVLGLEAFGLVGVTRDGAKLSSGLCVGLSYY